jgi:hypothetical protein
MCSCVPLLRYRYGAHLSKEQVAELVAPHPDTLELVNSWLEHHGVPSSSVSTTHGGGWLTLIGIPVSQANDLLGAAYQVYQHAETKDCILRTVGYALPEMLHGHVQTVAPTTYFGSPHELRQTPRTHSSGAALARPTSGELVKVLSSRVDFVTPSYLRSLYKTETYVPAATDQNVLGIARYFGDWPSQDDLATFMRAYRTDGADATFTLWSSTRSATGSTQANRTRRRTSTSSTPRASRTRPHTFTTAPPEGEGSSGGSTTCWTSRASHKQSARLSPAMSRISRKSLQTSYATCSDGLACVAPLSSSRAAMMALAAGTALSPTVLAGSDSSPNSLHRVCVMFFLCL